MFLMKNHTPLISLSTDEFKQLIYMLNLFNHFFLNHALLCSELGVKTNRYFLYKTRKKLAFSTSIYKVAVVFLTQTCFFAPFSIKREHTLLAAVYPKVTELTL